MPYLILGKDSGAPGTTIDIARFDRFSVEKDPYHYTTPGEAAWLVLAKSRAWSAGANPDGEVIIRGTRAECQAAKAALDRFLGAHTLEDLLALEPEAPEANSSDPDPGKRGPGRPRKG